MFKSTEFLDWTSVTDPALQAQNTKLEFTTFITSLGEKVIGNWSVTGLFLTFSRHHEKYIYAYYAPTIIFVVISWLSFLICHRQVIICQS